MRRRVARAAGALLAWGALAYSLGLVALAALWAPGAERPWWLAVSNIFAVYLFLPLPLLLLAGALVRSRPLRAAALITLLVFAAEFGARLLPPAPPPAAAQAGQRLRVMTFNHLYTNRTPDAVVAAIRAQGADVVALQELSGDVADAVDAQLADEYPYRVLQASPSWYGLGLLSRYPIVERASPLEAALQQIQIDVGGQIVTVVNVHLPSPRIGTRRIARRFPLVSGYDADRRERAAPVLLRTVDAASGPLIVLGDFNTAEREPLYAEMAARMRDSFRATSWGLGMTFPRLRSPAVARALPPVVRIDYVWARGLTPESSAVDCSETGSDHCQVLADLALPPPAAASR